MSRGTKSWKPAAVVLAALIIISVLAAAACKPSGKAQAARPGGPGAGGGAGMPAVPIVWAEAVLKDIPIEIRAIGRVEPFSSVSIKAQVTGEIATVNFQEGRDVRQGDVLFTIDSKPYEIALQQAQAILEKDRALLKQAEADAKRYGDLAAKEYVTREQVDKTVATRDTLIASIKADEAGVANARLQLDRCTVRSPIDGRTGSLLIYRGNLVRSSDAAPAVVINQITPIRVAFSAPEQNLLRIQDYRAKGDLKVQAVLNDGGAPAWGTLSFLDNAIDRTTGTIGLKAVFPNADRRLWPGQFVNVVLTLAVQANAVVVPSQAVQSGQGGQYVFVVKDDMTVEMKRPKIDRTVGNETVIAEGLAAGEKVVIDGQLQLVPGARVQVRSAK
jgi:membrane fusion protein, multidrug efflux system